jgi:hypothetical protein
MESVAAAVAILVDAVEALQILVLFLVELLDYACA